MSTTYCPICEQTAVRKSGDVCAICRAKGHKSINLLKADESDALVPLEEQDMGFLIERQIRQLHVFQSRLQKVLDGNEVFRGDALKEANNIIRALKQCQDMQEKQLRRSKQRAETRTLEEKVEYTVHWATSVLPKPTARKMAEDILDAVTPLRSVK